MNTIYKYLVTVCLLIAVGSPVALAQEEYTDATPVLITPHAQTIGALERTL